jgi:hypothetical protein
MAKRKTVIPARTSNEVRQLLLRYFYDRNANSTSARGKKGAAAKIRDVKAELKTQCGLSQNEVQSNLTYLICQGWVEEKSVAKEVRTPKGTLIPSTTAFFLITARGIDKIEGPGEFTMQKFHDIKIEATGQNIITVGDGNQVNAQFGELGKALADLRGGITESQVSELQKMSYVADIDTIQSQLAKEQPTRGIVSAAWSAVKTAATIDGCAGFVHRVTALIAQFLT